MRWDMNARRITCLCCTPTRNRRRMLETKNRLIWDAVVSSRAKTGGVISDILKSESSTWEEASLDWDPSRSRIGRRRRQIQSKVSLLEQRAVNPEFLHSATVMGGDPLASIAIALRIRWVDKQCVVIIHGNSNFHRSLALISADQPAWWTRHCWFIAASPYRRMQIVSGLRFRWASRWGMSWQ